MPHYLRLGEVPAKRHTQFRRPDGGLYAEHVMGTRGFSGLQSILYHHHPPTAVRRAEPGPVAAAAVLDQGPLRHRHFRTAGVEPSGDPISGRQVLLANADLRLSVCRPASAMDDFYRNADGDELIFVHYGSGRLETLFGTLSYAPGDYLVIPVGTTYQVAPDPGESRFLVLEAEGPIETPRRYRNEYGQLLEHAPYCERDIRGPEYRPPQVEAGEFAIRVRSRGQWTTLVTDHHPFDVAGWDGFLYPWAFNIDDFEPITGRIHQPPPVHQTFQGENFVVCSFVPRLFDYHPQAVPVPYNHSNVNSDEVLYYVRGNFMSRRGIAEASVTLHPSGLPHGPHPGTVEASLGKTRTEELAVMVDTFRPLAVTAAAAAVEDPGYATSWLAP